MVSRTTGLISIMGTSGLGQVHKSVDGVRVSGMGNAICKSLRNEVSDKNLPCHSINYVSKLSASAV